MRVARARCAAATKARADIYQDLLNEQKETEELIAQEAERDAKRKISKKNSDSTRTIRFKCPCNNSLCAIYTRRYAAMGSLRSHFFSFPRSRISGASSGPFGIDKSEDKYDPNLDDQDDKVTHYILVGLVAPHEDIIFYAFHLFVTLYLDYTEVLVATNV